MTEEHQKQIKDSLFSEINSPCVCYRVWEKNQLSGWRPNEERKGTKKRCEASRGESRSYALLRRERTALAPTDGFVFRHYDTTERYIEQYRENHCSTCMESEMEEKPVLGVHVPDPYLPKISTSSALMERMRIIEALSDYYKIASAKSSEMKNICLTGKRTEPTDRRALPDPPTRPSMDSLPDIRPTQGTRTQDDTALSTVCENNEPSDELEQRGADNLQLIRINNYKNDEAYRDRADKLELISIHKANSNKSRTRRVRESRAKRLPTPQVIYKSETVPAKEGIYKYARTQTKEQTVLPKVPHSAQWTETDRNGRERVLETLRIGRKMKAMRRDSNDDDDDSDDSRKNLGSSCGGEQLSSRGNLCLGTTLKSPNKNSKSHVQVGKCEVFSSTNPLELLQSITRKPKFPLKTTAFIKILGHATGPPPKPSKSKTDRKIKPRTSRDQPDITPAHYRLPLHYVRRFGGRHNFQHVLEARSYTKPENREIGTTIIPN